MANFDALGQSLYAMAENEYGDWLDAVYVLASLIAVLCFHELVAVAHAISFIVFY
jgi:hypothetical protein